MDEKAKALIKFVTLENRVWPKRWHELYQIIVRTHPDAPKPLILGGASASDLAKRIVLLQQIHEIKDDPRALDRADAFLRNEPASAWHLAPDPISNTNSYGHQDVPPLMHLLLML